MFQMNQKLSVRFLSAVLAALMALSVLALAGCGSGGSTTDNEVATTAAEGAETSTKITDTVVIDVKDYGKITVKLYPDVAPITVANFQKLVSEHFYDGLTFHRIISGFMIQGGDPNGDGTGGSDKNIKGEFSSNGVKNDLKHERGVISMARSMDPDSASSQFFIMHKAASHLDGQYAAFGRVTDGMAVVDKIAETVQPTDSNGTVPKADQPVINSITFK